MTNPPTPRAASEIAQLAPMCRALLDREERHLTTTLAALLEFRRLLATSEAGGMAQTLEAIQEAASAQGSISLQRDQFRHTAGMLLNVDPSAVSLRLIAEHLPGAEAAELMARRLRLRELVANVDRVNHGVALVVWWLLDFVHQVFAGIQGNPPGARYSPFGKIHAGPGGPLWQGQG